MKPPRLRPGDQIGVVSPSWGAAGLYPHRLENGIRQLEHLGFRTTVGRHAANSQGIVSDSAENRVSDLHDMFRDPGVRLVLAAIGGDHSCHLLPLLDFDLIAENPKIFMGFSDITVLNVAIQCETGLVTFNGPNLLTDFAEHPEMLEYTRSAFLRAVCEPHPTGRIAPAPWWTEEYLDWNRKEDLERPREGKASPGWTWLKDGVSEGVLVGGCLESLQHLRGTRYWPDFAESILFIETSADAPPPARVDSMLMGYENMGVFSQLTGLLVGRPIRYSSEQRGELRDVVLERTRRFSFPVVMDMDFGHTAPQFVLPLGCRARIDSGNRSFEILEAAVV